MSKMADLCLDIELMLEEGHNPLRIAEILEIPVTWVYDTQECMDEESTTEVYNPFKTVNS